MTTFKSLLKKALFFSVFIFAHQISLKGQNYKTQNDLQYAQELSFWFDLFSEDAEFIKKASGLNLVEGNEPCIEAIRALRDASKNNSNFDLIDHACLDDLKKKYISYIESGAGNQKIILHSRIKEKEKSISKIDSLVRKLEKEKIFIENLINKNDMQAQDLLKLAINKGLVNQDQKNELEELSIKEIADSIKAYLAKDYNDQKGRIELDIKKTNELRTELLQLESLDTSQYLQLIKIYLDKGLYSKYKPVTEENELTSKYTDVVVQDLPMKTLPSQTEIIDAIAVLITTRLKEEITLTFFGKLRDNLQNDSLLRIFFPRTLSMFNSIENFTMPSIGPTWKAAFGEDMALLPSNLSSYLTDLQKKNIKSSILNTDYTSFISSLVTMLNQTRKGSNLFDIIKIAKTQPGLDTSSAQYKILRNLDYLGTNLVDYSSFTDHFIAWSDFSNFNPIIQEYFLYQLNRATGYNVRTDNELIFIMDAFRRLEAEIRYLHKDEKVNGSVDINRYWTAIQDVIETSAAPLYKNNNNEEVKKALIVINSIIQIQKAIESQSWGYLPLPITDLLKVLIVDKNPWNVEGRLSNTASALLIDAYKKQMSEEEINVLKADISKCLSGSKPTSGCLNNSKYSVILDKGKIERLNLIIEKTEPEFLMYQNKRAIDHVVNTLSFISDVLTIDSSEELTKVIHAKAAPVSSYKIKRNSRFTLDLNAYPGLFLGGEWVKKGSNYTDGAWTTGFTVPIGLTFGIGKSSETKDKMNDKYTFQKKNGSYKTLSNNCWYFTLSLVDLAAPVSFRLGDPESETLPQKVTFAQFFAPGFFIGHGIKNTPLVFMIGGQLNPELRSFNEEPDLLNTFGVTATIAFDIPLFNVHNSIKKKRRFAEL